MALPTALALLMSPLALPAVLALPLVSVSPLTLALSDANEA